MKYVIKIFVILIPVLIFIGVARKAIDVNQQFLPTYEDVYAMFLSMPDLLADFSSAVSSTDELIRVNDAAWGNITGIDSFFSCIGTWFQMVGSFFVVAFNFVAVPFRFFAWFIPTFLGA